MRFLFTLILFLAAAPVLAQDENEPGFFDRLFGTDSAQSDNEQGSLLERLLEDALAGQGRDVRVRGFKGALSRRATLESLTISDVDGTWLELRDAVLDWDRAALFDGQLVVRTLSAAEITLQRLPKSQNENAGPGILSFKLPELPVSVVIDQLVAERVVLGAPVLGRAAEVSVEGSMSLADGEGAARFALNRLDGVGELALEGAFNNATDVLRVDLSLEEAKGGMFAELVDLPGRPSVVFSAKGEAPVKDFVADILLATDGEVRLGGQIKTSAPVGTAVRIDAKIGGDIAPLFAPEYRPFFGSDVQLSAIATRYLNGALAIEELDLSADALTLKGLVALAPGGVPERIEVNGSIGSEDGSPVLLPLLGAETYVDAVDLEVGFDAALDSSWTGRFQIRGFERADFAAELMTLAGSGQILSEPEKLTADFDFSVVKPDLGDGRLNQAIGEQVEGIAQINWQAGEPLRFKNVELLGATYKAAASGDLISGEAGRRFEGDLAANLEDLTVISGLVGRQLGGALEFQATGKAPLDLSSFALVMAVKGEDIKTEIPELDQLLEGIAIADFQVSQAGDVLAVESLAFASRLLTITSAGEIGGKLPLSVDMRLADIAPFASDFSGPVTLNGNLSKGERKRIVVDITGAGPGGSTARISGDVARDFADVAVAIQGRGPLGLLNRQLAPRTISGMAGFNLNLMGKPAVSSLSGRVTVPSARFVDPERRIVIEGIEAWADIAKGRADIDLAGRIDGGGRVTVRGPLALSGSLDGRLEVALVDARFTDPNLFDTSVNGQISIVGPLAGGARIAGDLRLGETNLRIPQSGVGGSGALPEITHINEPPPVRGTRRRAGLLGRTTAASGRRTAFPLNIRMSAPNRIFLRGRGLDSEFGGELRIGGTTANVVPSGGFSLIRGRLDILGRRLQLQEALITMRGSFAPVLRILAVTDAEGVQVTVLVEGPADSPEISFSSSPELPEEDVLARLIFGRGLETLSPIQAARLALAVRTLSGRGGEGVVGKIRRKSGLADFDITSDQDGNAAVRAGAYLGENIYTDVTVGAEGRTQLNLNLDISPSVTVKGGLANDGESSVGVFFERDY